MSSAFRCDRCYDFESDQPVLTVTMDPGPTNKTSHKRAFELCAGCLSDLHIFMQQFADTGADDA